MNLQTGPRGPWSPWTPWTGRPGGGRVRANIGSGAALTPADLTEPAFNGNGRSMTTAADFDVQLGAAVRAAREGRRITQAQLGKAVGVTFQQIQKYENGKNRIAASTLARIAEALDTTASELLGEPAMDADLPGARALLIEWLTLTPAQREAFLTLARGLNRR